MTSSDRPPQAGAVTASTGRIAPSSDADNRRGILAMLAACILFTINDTIVKLVKDALPTSEIIALRGLFALCFIGLLAAFLRRSGQRRGRLAQHRHKLVLARAGLEALVAFCFISALAHMPIGNITAVMQTVPLIVTALSVVLLGATVRWRRSLAIAIGFLGTLLVVRPDASGFTAAALLALAAAFGVALRDIVTRQIDPSISTLTVTVTTTVAVTSLGFLLAGFEAWVIPSPLTVLALAGAALVLTMGNFVVIVALRVGDMETVAPFRYSVILWALISGFLVWDEVPDMVAAIGIVLIGASGAYAVRRERVVAKQREEG